MYLSRRTMSGFVFTSCVLICSICLWTETLCESHEVYGWQKTTSFIWSILCCQFIITQKLCRGSCGERTSAKQRVRTIFSYRMLKDHFWCGAHPSPLLIAAEIVCYDLSPLNKENAKWLGSFILRLGHYEISEVTQKYFQCRQQTIYFHCLLTCPL